jgi:hypothetical protein
MKDLLELLDWNKMDLLDLSMMDLDHNSIQYMPQYQ